MGYSNQIAHSLHSPVPVKKPEGCDARLLFTMGVWTSSQHTTQICISIHSASVEFMLISLLQMSRH